MALSIKNPEAERLAKELAKRTGESVTQAVVTALRERLQREKGKRTAGSVREAIEEIVQRCAELPDLDTRSPDEILYDEHGLPR